MWERNRETKKASSFYACSLCWWRILLLLLLLLFIVIILLVILVIITVSTIMARLEFLKKSDGIGVWDESPVEREELGGLVLELRIASTIATITEEG